MQNKLTIRPAQQSDREAVFKFCEHTFDWGDYVPNVWDVWLKEKQAQLFTATLDNKPVGIMCVSIRKPGEAWLQAARTDPNYRRRGVATALTNACLEWAENKGSETARLSTDSDNYAAQKVLEALGFTQVSDFLIMKCEKLRVEETENSRWAKKGDLEKMWSFLTSSEVFKKSAGLYTVMFTWASLNKQTLARFIADKKAIVQDNNKAIGGLVLIDETIKDVWQEKPFQTCYIDGDRQVIVDIMKFFKTYSYKKGIMNVYAFACNTPTIAAALTEAGFSREETETELIYQKKLIP
ncbi:MAG: GNAT family N-acetyltransferase [Candidatus Bathyarchaeota archaeon]|nr:GNAT family N-acetyltransferase [Candidatus Bathyarchaeota archaeon]MDH5494307.1 GNAT family N-acetyltransferase [Candidatus Bathyarchaeota archaeon]